MTKIVEKFKKYFCYDEKSPSKLSWNLTRYVGKWYAIRIVKRGDFAGYRKTNGYYAVKVDGKEVKIHRIIYYLFHNDFDYNNTALKIDHIDGNVSNNAIQNLRMVSQSENNRNSKLQKSNKSGINGIHNFRSKGFENWRVSISYNGKKYTKSFSVLKYGKEALDMAIQWRDAKIKELGCPYSERHGKGE